MKPVIIGALVKEFAVYDRMLHAGHEYVRGDVHTNTIEGFFLIFKRSIKGDDYPLATLS